MQDYPRDLIGYGANPPDAAWPNGARIAVQFVLNYEEGGESSVLHNDAASEVFEHFSLPAYDSGQQPVLEVGGGIKSNKTIVPNGAILLSKLNPEIPRVWWPQNKGAHRQIASTEFLAFTAKSGISPALLYSLFSDQTFRQRLEGMVTGTSKSHQRVSPPALRSLGVLAGDAQVFTAFGQIVTSLMQKVLVNRAENHTLAQTRDLLLPKLMSGEIRVRESG